MNINSDSKSFNNYDTKNNINSVEINKTTGDLGASKSPIAVLKEGTVFKGKVINVTNNMVTITTDGKNTFSAKMIDSLNINIGEELDFYVQENNGKQVALKPYYNTLDQSKLNTLLKVLDANNLSPTQKNYQIADALINSQMSVDKASIQKVMQQSYNNPNAKIETLVALNKMGIEVNATNISQYDSYVNNQHQLINDVLKLAQNISNSYKQVGTKGSLNEVIDLNNKILSILDINNLSINESSNNKSNALENKILNQNDNIIVTKVNNENDITNTINETSNKGSNTGTNLEGLIKSNNGIVSEELSLNSISGNKVDNDYNKDLIINNDKSYNNGDKISKSDFTSENNLEMNNNINYKDSIIEIGKQLSRNGINIDTINNLINDTNNEEQFLSELNKLINNTLDKSKIKEILLSKEYESLINAVVKKKFSMDLYKTNSPKDIDDIYKGIYEKASKLANAFENGSNGQNELSNSGKQMQQKIDYIQILNNNYTYAQIPVRANNNAFNSELFVYLNKKKPLENNKAVSALLHLDMDNLGPTDVHVSLNGNTVHTKFYVQDENSAKLLDKHMNMLELQIVERGFSLTNEVINREVSINNVNSNNLVIDEITNKDIEKSVKRYSFDVRM